MAHPDPELLRLEEVVRLARDRLAGIIRLVPDAAALRAAEDLCVEASEAVAAYRAHAATLATATLQKLTPQMSGGLVLDL
jgi:hypothetical protein